jgi:glycosyltransferase involved in cell wall biosynthesis
VAPEKVKVVPFGANLECDPSRAEVEAAIDLRPTKTCRLLFIGANATRKGADIAVQIAADLNAVGLPTRLTLVGGTPASEGLPEYVTCLGYIDKSVPKGHAELERVLASSHFLLGPSRADCTPIAFCEANAFGVPCLARDTGGISSVVRNGINGCLFDKDAPAREYSVRVLSIMRDRTLYRELALSSYEHYRTRLNWDVSIRTVLQHIQAIQTAGCRQAECGRGFQVLQ